MQSALHPLLRSLWARSVTGDGSGRRRVIGTRGGGGRFRQGGHYRRRAARAPATRGATRCTGSAARAGEALADRHPHQPGLPPDARTLERLADSTDQVVVSVDGDEASHDARRGAGTYARTVANLRALLAANPRSEVGITAVLTAEQMDGPEGEAVRTLGEELDVRVRFKSVLPLGRGAELGLTPAFYSSLDDDIERVAYAARPASTCGLGMNLYVGPDGGCYPCYALMGERHRLGNALDEGLATVLARNNVYRRVTVDSNLKCRTCALRYVCGGFCRAWRTRG